MKNQICIFNTEILELEKLADVFTCDGYCDEEPPHVLCKECMASSALNYIGEIIDETRAAAAKRGD